MVRAYLRHVASFSDQAKLFLLAELLAGIGHGTFIVLRNLYLKQCGLSEGFIGQAMSISALGTMVVTVPLAFFMGRGGFRAYLVAGALASALGLIGTALWPTPAPVLVSSFVAGAGASLLGVGAGPFYMRNSTPVERPFLFAVGTALGPLAGLVGAGLVWSLSSWLGESAPAQQRILLVASAITVVGAVPFVLLRDDAPGPAPREKQEFDRVTAAKLCLPAFIIGLGAGLTIPFINLYFHDRFGLSAGLIATIFVGAQVVTFFAFLSAPAVARRMGGVPAIVACQLLSLPFFLVMALTMSPWLAVAGFLGRHALMNMTGPVQSNFAMEVVPERQRMLTNSLREVAWSTSWMLATSLGGWMIGHARLLRDGYTVTMLTTIGLYVVGSVLFWAFWRKSTVLRSQSVAKLGLEPD
jgi:MFS family permease